MAQAQERVITCTLDRDPSGLPRVRITVNTTTNSCTDCVVGLQWSDDLRTWRSVSGASGCVFPELPLTLVDRTAGPASRRFYRVAGTCGCVCF